LRSATSDSFDAILKKKVFVDVLPETDYTTKVVFNGLPLGQDMFYRVRLQDLFEPPIRGEPMIGRFRTAPADRRNVTFCWSGDTAGQGWGIDESRGGGMTIYSAIAGIGRISLSTPETTSMPMDPSRPGRSCRTVRPGNTSRPRKVEAGRNARRVPRRLQIQCFGQEPACDEIVRCRFSRRGTTTKCSTIGGRASR